MTDTPMTTTQPLPLGGLAPDEVPTALDAVGRPAEAVVSDSRVAWTHWDETRWVRA